jgi:hypothetical protein
MCLLRVGVKKVCIEALYFLDILDPELYGGEFS